MESTHNKNHRYVWCDKKMDVYNFVNKNSIQNIDGNVDKKLYSYNSLADPISRFWLRTNNNYCCLLILIPIIAFIIGSLLFFDNYLFTISRYFIINLLFHIVSQLGSTFIPIVICFVVWFYFIFEPTVYFCLIDR